VKYDVKTSEYSFKGKFPDEVPLDLRNVEVASHALTSIIGNNVIGVGVDQGNRDFLN